RHHLDSRRDSIPAASSGEVNHQDGDSPQTGETMYKLLLCWRYLRTRYLALVCIISVLLGVATLIVVNSVMAGFSTKLRERLHAALSDVVIQSWDYTGMSDPEGKMRLIRADPELAKRIKFMT